MRYLALIVLFCGATAQAQPLPGDPHEGLAFARGHCGTCHYVEELWTGTSPYMAPAFADIAVNPKYTELALRVFLRTPHSDMPNFILTPDETDDVISYILSLKPMPGN